MAFKIKTEICTACGTCAENCPVEAIQKKGEMFEVDPDTCVDCGSCENNCPVGAILS